MKELTMNFTVEELNLILESLGNQPFNKVYRLIEKIQAQAAPQLSSSNNGHIIEELPEQEKVELDKELIK